MSQEIIVYKKTIKMWKEISTSSRLLSKSEVIGEQGILCDCFLCDFVGADDVEGVRCSKCLINEWSRSSEYIPCFSDGYSEYLYGLRSGDREKYLKGSRKILRKVTENYLFYLNKNKLLRIKKRMKKDACRHLF